MQSLETSGQLRAAAARRTQEGKFWRDQLAGDWSRGTPLPDLPGRDDGCTRRLELGVPADLAREVAEKSRNSEAALEVLLLSATAVVLARHAGAADFVLGHPGTLDDAGGPNTLLPLRMVVNGALGFRDFVADVRARYLAGLEHQDYPFAVLPEQLGLPAEPHGHPLLDVAVAAGRPERIPTVGLRLMVALYLQAGEPALHLAYDGGRWQADTIRRLGARILAVLAHAVAQPGTPLADLEMADDTDRALLARFNDTACAYRDGLRLESVLAQAVLRAPDAPALVGDGYVTTHAQLNARSDAVARHLKRAGVGRDRLVGVMLERSPDMMAAIFGVLKAGGAWLPLDPSQPDARLRHMLEDSRAPVLLAAGAHAERGGRLAEGAGCVAVDMEAMGDAAGEGAGADDRGPRDIAYAIYTSGSTGLPKAALVEHHSVFNRIDWMQKAYPIGPGDVVLQKTTIAFDVSVWELFWWAFSSATLCMLPPGAEKDPARLIDTIERHRVTTLHFVPSMLQAFLDYVETTGSAERVRSLRQVFASGEALGGHQVERFARLLGGAGGTRLVNLYGPTEATVDVTHHACDAAPGPGVPIGKPIDNLRLHVVDDRLRPQPVDVPGELCISGVGLARGYLHRPELTRERFVDAPFPGEERLYRTGDLARWRADGTIEYLGRIDHQVKIRGYRIELGEIEHRLRELPGVGEAVVLTRSGPAGDVSLVGWVCAGVGIDEAAVRRDLAAHLPDYMVPSRIVVVDSFPLTPNGKLDRKALPEPVDEVAFEAPHDGVEALLAGIWCEVLGRARVGRHDNFFALGGNSIHFVSVLARARRHGLGFGFETLFAHPTVASLAPHVGREAAAQADAGANEPFALLSDADRGRLPAGLEDAYPMTQLQAGLIFENEIAQGTAQYHDILTYVIHGAFDAARFTESVRRMVHRNAIFRASYHLQAFDENVQQVHREGDLPLPLFIEDLRGLDGPAQDAWLADWVERERAHQFEWERGGLVRLHVQVLRDDLFHYTLSQHNSALDGWSITLVHAQIFETYFGLLADPALPEGPKPHNHIRDYVVLERAALASAADRAFWADRLAGGSPNHLARWEPERAADGLEVRFHDVEIPRPLSDALMALADRLNVPLKNVLMAAHVRVLSAASARGDVVAGYEHSGRPEVEAAEEAVGLFLNTIPLRVDVAAARTWRDLVRRVYEAEIALLPHRRYPMASMKSDLGEQRPLFETAFNFTHFYRLKRLRDLPDFALLDVRASSETEFTLRAEFSRHFYTDEVRLSLHYHTNVFPAAQVVAFAALYRHVFEAMVRDADAPADDEFLERHRAQAAVLNAGRTLPAPWREAVATAPSTDVESAWEAPRTDSEKRVAELWAKVLDIDVEEIGRDDNFFDLGGNSLAAMRVVILLKRQVSLVEFMRNSSLRPLADLLDVNMRRGAQVSLLHVFTPAPAQAPRQRLVCVPYAGGNAINFRPLALALAQLVPDLEVVAVELPGHDPSAGADEAVDVAQAAQKIIAALAGRSALPTHLWGHCAGSTVALEMARLLQKSGSAPAGLFIGGKLYPRPDEIRQSIAEVSALDEAGIAAALAANTGYAELAGAGAELVSRTARLFRHDALAAHRYLLDVQTTWEGQRLALPVTVVVAGDDPYTPRAEQGFGHWRAFSSDVRLQRIADGGHYFCRTRAAQVAGIVAAQVAQAGQEVSK